MSRTCLDCKQYQANGGSCFPRQVAWADDCVGFHPRTFFHRITESPETLAEKSVYQNYIGLWRSPFIQWGKDTKAEAIAATVAKLKEVAK